MTAIMYVKRQLIHHRLYCHLCKQRVNGRGSKSAQVGLLANRYLYKQKISTQVLMYCWAMVEDSGPTISRHCVNVVCR